MFLLDVVESEARTPWPGNLSRFEEDRDSPEDSLKGDQACFWPCRYFMSSLLPAAWFRGTKTIYEQELNTD